MGLVKEFKVYLARGNMIDVGLGLVIAQAFGRWVQSLVDNVIMPSAGFFLGRVDIKSLKVVLKLGFNSTPPVTINYGLFISSFLDLIIIAFCVFLVIRFVNRLRRKYVDHTKECPECKMEIPLSAHKCGFCGLPFEDKPKCPSPKTV